jgi:Tfp pilus assembly protein PilF
MALAMNIPLDPAPPANRASVHVRALTLAAVLLVVFIATTGLYARYGYRFVLRVYEQHQLGRVADAKGSGKLVEYEDYLRVDPSNLRMRGLLINQLIEFHDPGRALAVAQEGGAAVLPDQRPIAMLLVARAQIALGHLDAAEATYRDVLAAIGESGEAHYGLAHIAAARGDFALMRDEYKKYNVTPKINVTPDHAANVAAAYRRGDYDYANTRDAILITAALHQLYLGNVDSYLKGLALVTDFDKAPPSALFWRGVYEEEQGHRDAALDFYKRAAAAGDALGKFAYGRLSGSK